MNDIPLNTSVVSIVVVATVDGAPKLLLMKRAREGFWCHVAGSIESDEKAWEAACRELREETGVVATELYDAGYLEQFYEPERNCITIIPAFVVILDGDINIQLNHEHLDYKWCSLEEAKELAPYPNQRNLYDHVWTHFVESAPSKLGKITP